MALKVTKLQHCLFFSNLHSVEKFVGLINQAIDARDERKLVQFLSAKEVALGNVKEQNGAWYMQNLTDEKISKAEVSS